MPPYGGIPFKYPKQVLLSDKEGELVEILKCDTGTTGHSTQRIVGDVDLQFGLAGDTLV